MKNVEKIAQDILDDNIRSELLSFFKNNPNPSDDDVHEWSEEKGYDADKVEEIIYRFATKFVNFWTGGRSNEKGIKREDVDKKQLAMGIEVEYEHTPDKDVSEKITLDHLAEIKDYYTRLDKMESEAGVEH